MVAFYKLAMMLRTNDIFLSFLMLSCLGICKNIAQNEVITWSSIDPLEWSDFSGEIVYRNDIIAAAETIYKIEISPLEVLVDEEDNIQNYQELTVVTLFFPNKSWVNQPSDELLDHEQLHFDIAELFARKMRREFSKLKEAKEAQMQVYQDVWNNLWKTCRAMQQKYDSDTNHGINGSAQLSWNQRIKSQLDVYEIYALK